MTLVVIRFCVNYAGYSGVRFSRVASNRVVPRGRYARSRIERSLDVPSWLVWLFVWGLRSRAERNVLMRMVKPLSEEERGLVRLSLPGLFILAKL